MNKMGKYLDLTIFYFPSIYYVTDFVLNWNNCTQEFSKFGRGHHWYSLFTEFQCGDLSYWIPNSNFFLDSEIQTRTPCRGREYNFFNHNWQPCWYSYILFLPTVLLHLGTSYVWSKNIQIFLFSRDRAHTYFWDIRVKHSVSLDCWKQSKMKHIWRRN